MLDREVLRRSHETALGAAEHVKLAIASAPRGPAGSTAGRGTGSSIDFQDHREYHPGDDLRHIDWNAYAKTGRYITKLYREEVTPKVDVLLDISASMWCGERKRRRSAELLYFATESARRIGASVRLLLVDSNSSRLVPGEMLYEYRPFEVEQGRLSAMPLLDESLLRSGSLRVFISDLLFPGAPQQLLQALAVRGGEAMILSPYSREEASPSWRGNVRFIDCESDRSRQQYISDEVLERYKASYGRHFELWQSGALRAGIRLARIEAEPALVTALSSGALGIGALEQCS